MNTCDTCKHWGSTGDRYAFGIQSECSAVAELQSKHDDVPVNGAGIAEACNGYGERLQPALITGPKFGCIHWEAKE